MRAPMVGGSAPPLVGACARRRAIRVVKVEEHTPPNRGGGGERGGEGEDRVKRRLRMSAPPQRRVKTEPDSTSEDDLYMYRDDKELK